MLKGWGSKIDKRTDFLNFGSNKAFLSVDILKAVLSFSKIADWDFGLSYSF